MALIRIFFFLLVSTIAIPGSAQNISKKLINYQSTHHQEKIYISHDKPTYAYGDTIWAKVFFLDAKTHKVFDLSPIVNVEWINPKGEIDRSFILKIEEGTAAFEIPIDLAASGGEYVLRAYTQYQKNFDVGYIFRKTIKVFDQKIIEDQSQSEKPFDIKFYPEGGDIVCGIRNRIAFEVLNHDNQDDKLVGEINDEVGNKIVEVKTIHENIGVFEFVPEKDKTYNFYSFLRDESIKVALPPSLSTGFVLNVNGVNKDYISLSINASEKNLLKGASVIGHVRGQVFMEEVLDPDEQNVFKIIREQVPSGILHFTLFDADENPVCERLTFNRNINEQVVFKKILSDSIFNSREEVGLELMPTLNGIKAIAESSVSVFNKDLFAEGTDDMNIESYMLLNSDLVVNIPNANDYITNKSTRTNYLLDMMLMTKTWRRFVWQDVIREKFPEFTYGTQEDIQFIGKVKKRNKDKTVAANISLFAIGEELINTKIQTDDDGIFYFKGFHFKDTTDVFLQAHIVEEKKKKKRKSKSEIIPDLGSNKVDIEMVKIDTLPFELDLVKPQVLKTKEEVKLEKIIQKEIIKWDSLVTADLSVDIDEVIIKESRLKSKAERDQELRELLASRGIRYTNLTQKFYTEDMPGAKESYDIFNLLTTAIPRLYVRGGGAVERHVAQTISNGVAGNLNNDFKRRYFPVPVLINHRYRPTVGMQVDPQKIVAIEVKYDVLTNSIIYINVISEKLDDLYRDKKRGTLTITHPGYYQAREFYQPNYIEGNIKRNMDRRTTLYWNANLKIDESGENISFYTGDIPGTYQIIIEGITESGIPFVHKEEIIIH